MKKMLTVPDTGPPERTPFERFSDFARKIVAVQKSELAQVTKKAKRPIKKPRA